MNEIRQITRRQGDTILARTFLIKFRHAIREKPRRLLRASPDPPPGHGRRVH